MKSEILKYITTAVVQGILAGTVQYVFQEVDEIVGTALMLTPLSLVNISSIKSEKLPNYILGYLYSSLFSLSMAIFFYFLLKKTGNTRAQSHRILLITIAVYIASYIIYHKNSI